MHFSDILSVERAEAKSWYVDHNPNKAYDGDYNTYYSVKDGDALGNYLKLFLSQTYQIGSVKLTNRKEGCCEQRIVGTKVMVYLTGEDGEETKVADCGEKISRKLHCI